MNAQTEDPRSDEMNREMADHFAEMEINYRDSEWCTVVYEDRECVLIADHSGHEFSEWQGEFENFSETMHEFADQITDRNWGSDYPVMFDKLADHQ